MTQTANPDGYPFHRTGPNGTARQADMREVGDASPARVQAANEMGAAIVHQLNGPLTALLLYVGDLKQTCDQFPAKRGDDQSFKEVVDGVHRETERVCSLLRRLGDTFEAPFAPQTAVAHGREIIGWWSRSTGGNVCDVATADISRIQQEPLTRREQETLKLVSEGCSNKEGAVRMSISPRTFESHRAGVMRKLGARNSADMIRLAHNDVR